MPPTHREPASRLWRVFPWDPHSPEGAPFSLRYVPPPGSQTKGRFDLGTIPILYLAETPEHAVAEMLRPFIGQRIASAHLVGAGRPLALVSVTLPPEISLGIADLTDPAVLLRYGIRPDTLASRDRARTQSISRSLHTAELLGFRWWSSLGGDWHATVLFLDRVPVVKLNYGDPEALSLRHPAVLEATHALNITL
jgi:hypothetical protein